MSSSQRRLGYFARSGVTITTSLPRAAGVPVVLATLCGLAATLLSGCGEQDNELAGVSLSQAGQPSSELPGTSESESDNGDLDQPFCTLPPTPECAAQRVVLGSQSAINTFAAWGCTAFAGEVILAQGECPNEPAISSLLPLEGLIGIEGNLELVDLAPGTNLLGLSNLTQIKSLRLSGLALADLSAFANLKSVVELSITDMPQLRSLSGLEHLMVTGSLHLENLPAFVDASALATFDLRAQTLAFVSLPALPALPALHLGAALREVVIDDVASVSTLDFLGHVALGSPRNDARLVLRNLPNLRDLGALAFGSGVRQLLVDSTGIDVLTPMPSNVVGEVVVRNNPSLTAIEGQITLTHASFVLAHNPLLSSISQMHAASTPTTLSFTDLPALRELSVVGAIERLAPETLVIDTLPALRSLAALRRLTQVGARYSGCEVSCSPDGLESAAGSHECAAQIQVWTGGLTIRNNAALTSLAGLEQLGAVGGHLEVTGSDRLVDAQVCILLRTWRELAGSAAAICGAWVDPMDIGSLCEI